MPAEFNDVQMCIAMNCDFWTLQAQPARHLELMRTYLIVKNKVEQQKAKEAERKAKTRGR